MKELFKSSVFYFINNILNKIPSRSFRIFFYHLLSGGKIKKSASIGLGVRILDIRNVIIGERTNINYCSIIDGRGQGIEISHDVDIAPQVNIWSLEHDPDSSNHETRSGKVIVEHHVWIANNAIILPNTSVGAGSTIGAGAVVKGRVKKSTIGAGNPFKVIKERRQQPVFKLSKIRRFR